jgi:hypothetical protein
VNGGKWALAAILSSTDQPIDEQSTAKTDNRGNCERAEL